MHAVKAFGPQDLRLVTIPEPTPGAGEVLLAVRASGTCGSDKWYWRVEGPTENIAGHEVAGEVIGVGPGVTSLKVGDRVAVNNVVGCGRCSTCRAGAFVRCTQRGQEVNHGFCEQVVAPARNCLRLHDAISYEAGCLIFDNWGTPYGALSRAQVGVGDDVVISGCGPIGLGAVALAKQRGAYVIAIDPIPYRQQAAWRIGADAVLTPGDDTPQAIRELTGGVGASVFIECSGVGKAYAPGLHSLRACGTFVSVGENARVDFEPSRDLIRNNLNLLGSWYSTMHDGKVVQDLMVRGEIDPFVFVTHYTTLAELPAAFARVVNCEDDVLKTIVLMPAGDRSLGERVLTA